MNPKKQIMKFLSNPSCDHPPDESCDICEKVRHIQGGMSAGTAVLYINNSNSEKCAEDFQLKDLVNRERYYIGRVVDFEGKTIEKLLVEKQTGEVRFV